MQISIIETSEGGFGHISPFLNRLMIIFSKNNHYIDFLVSSDCYFNNTRGHLIKYVFNKFSGLNLLNQIYNIYKLFINVNLKSKIFFFSSCNIIVCAFWALVYKKKNSLTKILITNNYHDANFFKNVLLKCILKQKITFIFYDKSQLNFLKKKFNLSNIKNQIIPHYAINEHQINKKKLNKKQLITFFSSPNKEYYIDIKSFLNLYERSQKLKEEFNFQIFGYNKDQQLDLVKKFKIPKKLFVTKQRSKKNYLNQIKKSDFILLLYTKKFEYRVSGILFDSISLGTKIIASNRIIFKNIEKELPYLISCFNLMNRNTISKIIRFMKNNSGKINYSRLIEFKKLNSHKSIYYKIAR